jgi:hypothetical protein
MKLHEALEQSRGATKHVDGPVAGTYSVSKANLSAGYYKDFQPDDSEQRSPFCTSSYWGYDYPGADPLARFNEYYGEDGWEPR